MLEQIKMFSKVQHRIGIEDSMILCNLNFQGELMKEIKRFQRMQIDLKSNLDRIQWRLDCESKVRENFLFLKKNNLKLRNSCIHADIIQDKKTIIIQPSISVLPFQIYHSVMDQYHKMQMDLYYLKNLNEKTSARDQWC